MAEDRPLNRRLFFRRGLSELLKPLAQAIAPIHESLDQLAKLDKPAPVPAPPPRMWLRPPGAGSESDFRDKCSKCGICVDVCPVHAIQIDPTSGRGGGLPFIEPNESACVLCDGLHCMKECPTDALLMTPRDEVDIGTAVWKPGICVRTTEAQDCELCVAACPIGPSAIELGEAGEVVVHPLGCTGCGTCQHVCPTTPKSIVVIPIAAKSV